MRFHKRKDSVMRMREREATAGLDLEDEAARWLAAHDAPPPEAPKAAKKSKLLHRFRARERRTRP